MRTSKECTTRFAGVLEPAQQVEVIRRMRAAHEHRLGDLRRQLETEEFDDPLHRMTIEFGAGWNEWAIGWCEEAERRLRPGRRGRHGNVSP